jgi:hypothetical protein
MRWVLIMFAFATSAASASAAEPEAKEFTSDGKTLPYRLLKPGEIEAGKKYPLK